MNNPLATWFEQFIRERTYFKNVTPATLRWYRIAFKSYQRAIVTDTAALPTRATLRFCLAASRSSGSPGHMQHVHRRNERVCAWLHAEGHTVDRVKLGKLRIERRCIQILNEAQLRALIEYAPSSFGQRRVHLAAMLVLDTGLRISEALHLRPSDVDYDNLILKVFGKGQKERLVPFSPELRKRLYRYEQLRAKKRIGGEFLFGGVSGTRWEKRNSATSLYLMERKLGLPTFGWHRLRHTFATNYLRHGGDIVRLSMA